METLSSEARVDGLAYKVFDFRLWFTSCLITVSVVVFSHASDVVKGMSVSAGRHQFAPY